MSNDDSNLRLDRESRKALLASFQLLVQLTMSIAFSIGVVVFLTGGTGASLRSLSSYTIVEVGRFAVFLLSAIAFVVESAIAMQMRIAIVEYGYLMFRVRMSFVFRILISLLYVAMSLTLSTKADPLAFFYVYGLLLAVGALWSIAIAVIGSGPIDITFERGLNVVEALLGIVLIGVGIYFVQAAVPNYQELLIGLCAVDAVVFDMAVVPIVSAVADRRDQRGY
jgi:hypothetical protein